MSLTKEQFLDLCILCGTDYNSKVKGYGPATSYKAIKKYESLEKIFPNQEDFSLYTRVREIFTESHPTEEFENYDSIKIGQLDKTGLEEFLNSFYEIKDE